MKKFLLNLQFLFKPKFWLISKKYSKEIDLIVSDLLYNFEFTDITHHTAKLGNIEFWIANEPYFDIYNHRPSRLTIQKGLKKLKDKQLPEFYEEAEIIRKHNHLTN